MEKIFFSNITYRDLKKIVDIKQLLDFDSLKVEELKQIYKHLQAIKAEVLLRVNE